MAAPTITPMLLLLLLLLALLGGAGGVPFLLGGGDGRGGGRTTPGGHTMLAPEHEAVVQTWQARRQGGISETGFAASNAHGCVTVLRTIC